MRIVLDLPRNLNILSFEVKMIIASKLFHDGKLSSGQAADIVDLSKRAFLEHVGKYGVSIFGTSIDDIESDLKNA